MIVKIVVFFIASVMVFMFSESILGKIFASAPTAATSTIFAIITFCILLAADLFNDWRRKHKK
jgi:threonine/homoserine/homoserine lactone efflux protein